MGNPLQDRAVLSVFGRHHIGYHLWTAAWVRAGAAPAFYSSRPPFAKGVSERGGVRQLNNSSAVLKNGDMGMPIKVAEARSCGNFALSEITPGRHLNLRIRTTVFAKPKAYAKWMVLNAVLRQATAGHVKSDFHRRR
jgi:hypothetical protein